MQNISAVPGIPEVVSKADMASLSTDGTMRASARALEESDFCNCILEGRSCANAARIYKGLDAGSSVLLCLLKGHVNIEGAISCTDQK